MTATEAIELYRATKASRYEANGQPVHHSWQDERRKPVPGGFRIYPIPTEEVVRFTDPHVHDLLAKLLGDWRPA